MRTFCVLSHVSARGGFAFKQTFRAIFSKLASYLLVTPPKAFGVASPAAARLRYRLPARLPLARVRVFSVLSVGRYAPASRANSDARI